MPVPPWLPLWLLSYRGLALLLVLACGDIYLAVLALQYGLGLAPCPLCVLQRWALGGVALCAALQLAVGTGLGRPARLLPELGLLASAATGAWLAWHHRSLQLLPPELQPQSCTQLPMDYLMETLPLGEVIATALEGGGCGEVQWTLLGIDFLTIPMLALLAFCGLAAAGLAQLARKG